MNHKPTNIPDTIQYHINRLDERIDNLYTVTDLLQQRLDTLNEYMNEQSKLSIKMMGIIKKLMKQ